MSSRNATPTIPELLDYCRRSANPVGRLVLHLFGRTEPEHLAQSDCICSALQLVNFWQDVAVDWQKQRIYIPQADLPRFRVSEADIAAGRWSANWAALMDFQIDRTRELMLRGAPLVHALPGRLGWEIRLTVQGGLRILERLRRVRGDVFERRPTLGKRTGWSWPGVPLQCEAMNPDEYCQEKCAASGSSFYYSFLFLPAGRRRAIMALYAFCREVDDVVDECNDIAIASTKLAWWRQEVERIATGQPTHPVGLALQEVSGRFNLPKEQLLEIIDGMEMDLQQSRYLDFKGLSLYCYRVASVVGLLAAEIFGARTARRRSTRTTSAWPSSSPTSSATSARTRDAAASTSRWTSSSGSTCRLPTS
jgi:phytoene/squalene synthetase